MEKDVSIGNLISETISLLQDASRDALIFILVLGGLSAIGVISGFWATNTMTYGMDGAFNPAASATAGLFGLIIMVAYIVGQYMLVKRYLAARGRLRDDSNRFWPYLGMAILAGLGIALGLVLLIVPGLFLLVRWSAATGYVVGERRGVIESLGASWEATKGHGWTIFFTGLVVLIAAWLAAAIVGGIFGFVNATLGGIVSSFLETAVSAITIALGVTIYCSVSDDTGNVSEVFS